MIRIYLDWNVVSNLKKSDFQDIKDYISKHKDYLQFPYSPAHFNDLMKSYTPENSLFDIDLKNLEWLSGKHLIRWGENGIEPLFGTPAEYFEGENKNKDTYSLMDIEKVFEDLDDSTNDLGLGNISTMMKSLFQMVPTGIEITNENQNILKKMFPNLKPDSTMWDLMKDIGPFSQKLLQDGEYYKDFRKSLKDHGLKLDSNSGNWNYDEVLKNIDEFLLGLGTKMKYLEFVETIFKHKKEPINSFEYYTTAYLLLDMFGYKTDKLPKITDNMQNIQTDAIHSFYGAYCDYIVAIDKKLRIKSKVLYNEFSISTKIIEPKQLISELEKVIYFYPKDVDFIEEALSFCIKENLVESYPITDDNKVESHVFKLPIFYFNFFNYVIYREYPEQEGIMLTFKKVFKNFSRFIYYTESERLVDSITMFFGYDDKIELKKRKTEFVYEDMETTFIWNFNGGMIKLENEEETRRPVLNYIMSTKKNSG